MAAIGFTIPGNPGEFRKGDAAIRYAGAKGKCKCCGKPLGRPFIVQASLGKALRDDMAAAAFQGGLAPLDGPVALGMVAHWPRKWGPDGRAPGRPCGDVDAPVSNILDGLASLLYADDAQVAVLVAANAIATTETARIDVVARPVSPALLAALTAGLGLPFDTARLTLGQQGKLL